MHDKLSLDLVPEELEVEGPGLQQGWLEVELLLAEPVGPAQLAHLVGAEAGQLEVGLGRAVAALEMASVESGPAGQPKIAADREPTVRYRITDVHDLLVEVKKADPRRYAQYEGELLTKG